jgi:serine/threonine-protein kinase
MSQIVYPLARNQSAQEFLLIIAAFLSITAGCGRSQPQEPTFPVQDADVPRILVMPYESLGAPEDAFLAVGMTREITNRLAAVKGLGFVSRARAEGENTAPQTAVEIGRELGVDYVLSGSVLWDRDAEPSAELQVESRLDRLSDGSVSWSEHAVRSLSDIFAIQSGICHAVVDHIRVAIDSGERRALDVRPTDNLEAYQEYLRGIANSWSFELGELELAERHLSRAVTLDPDFAVAHAALSENHSLMFHFRYDRAPHRLARANAAAQRAHEIDSNLPEGHRARGYYYYWGQRNYELALTEFSLAAHGRPNDPLIMASIGLVLRRQGRWQEALAALQRAAEIVPKNHDTILDLASTLGRARRYEEAVDHCRRAIELAPDDIYPYVFLAQILRLRDGSIEQARHTLEEMPAKDPAQQVFYWYEQAKYERDFARAIDALEPVDNVISDPIGEIVFTRSLAACECRTLARPDGPAPEACERALEYLQRAREISPADPAVHAALGWAHALIGNKEAAIDAGERAVELTPITADAMAGHSYLVRLAKIYAWVDEPYLAVKTIHTALATPGWISMSTLELDPDWDPIRNDPRFKELLRIHSGDD